jgi:CRISP-associated protein Cas1
MVHNLHDLPRFQDGLSYLYAEHCKIEQDNKAIALFDKKGKTPVPCAALALLLIGPGTSITHEAIKNLTDCGCLLYWVGEYGVRFYAQGQGETRSAKNIIRQAYYVSNPQFRLLVAKKMYSLRFKEKITLNATIQNLRGREGARMKKIYQSESKRTGVIWKGRNYNRKSWSSSDPINRALSAANSCLYGLCHAAIVSLGYSPALGFIHTGKNLSFVYDIADLLKSEVSIPLAFEIVAENELHVASRVRIQMRNYFTETNLLKTIVSRLQEVFKIEEYIPENDKEFMQIIQDLDQHFYQDAALPGFLWDPDQHAVAGGQNFTE